MLEEEIVPFELHRRKAKPPVVLVALAIVLGAGCGSTRFDCSPLSLDACFAEAERCVWAGVQKPGECLSRCDDSDDCEESLTCLPISDYSPDLPEGGAPSVRACWIAE